MLRRCIPVYFLAALLIDSAAAQVPLGAAGGVRGGQSSAASVTLAGTVRTASGETPTEPVAIRRECGVDSFIEGYTGRRGRFSFEVGGDVQFAVMEAAAGGPVLGLPPDTHSIFKGAPSQAGFGVDLSHCHLVADLPGYRSTHIPLTRRRSLDRPDVGTLILTPLDESQAAVSATTLAAPDGARKALDRAVKELSKGRSAKLLKAMALLEKAVLEYPAYAAAWTILGETKQRVGDTEGAAEAYGRAMEADAGYLRPYEPMAMIRVQQQDWEQAMKLTGAALDLDPANVVLRWIHAVSQFELGHDEEALAALDRVERDEAGADYLPQTHHIRGLIYSKQGDFAKAAEELRLFLKAAPAAPAAKAIEERLDEWKELGVVQPRPLDSNH